MKKLTKMNEAAWCMGLILCSLGISLATKAGLGLSMIAAPPYIIHIKMIKYFSFYTQGTSEYIFEGILLVVLCIIVRRFKLRYLLSFVTAVIFGKLIDMWLYFFGGSAVFSDMAIRIAAFYASVVCVSTAVAFYFRTRMPLTIYELIVREISDRFGFEINRVKHINDISMLCLSFILAFSLNRSIDGIGVGTIVVTVVNAPLIKLIGKGLDRVFEFDSVFAANRKSGNKFCICRKRY